MPELSRTTREGHDFQSCRKNRLQIVGFSP